MSRCSTNVIFTYTSITDVFCYLILSNKLNNSRLRYFFTPVKDCAPIIKIIEIWEKVSIYISFLNRSPEREKSSGNQSKGKHFSRQGMSTSNSREVSKRLKIDF